MSTLKELRLRIKSVKSTQKITSAMKMVASAKLKRAQEALFKSRDYAKKFHEFALTSIAHLKDLDELPALMRENIEAPVLIISAASHRGLCGGYNAAIAKATLKLTKELEAEGKKVIWLPIGKKLMDLLPKDPQYTPSSTLLLSLFHRALRSDLPFNVQKFPSIILQEFIELNLRSVYLVTGQFMNALSQPVQVRKILPFEASLSKIEPNEIFFEPSLDVLLPQVLSHDTGIQLKVMLLENSVCEHAARMTAMDNASRNAKDMIHTLQLKYNQGRQSQITNELIEILAGASAAC